MFHSYSRNWGKQLFPLFMYVGVTDMLPDTQIAAVQITVPIAFPLNYWSRLKLEVCVCVCVCVWEREIERADNGLWTACVQYSVPVIYDLLPHTPFCPIHWCDDTHKGSEREPSQVGGWEPLRGTAVLSPSRVTPLDVAARRMDICGERLKSRGVLKKMPTWLAEVVSWHLAVEF